jgi:hypothetical protein
MLPRVEVTATYCVQHLVPVPAGTSATGALCYLMQSKDHNLSRDDRRLDQPMSKKDAPKPGVKEQKEAAAQQVESPGEPVAANDALAVRHYSNENRLRPRTEIDRPRGPATGRHNALADDIRCLLGHAV